MGNVVSQEDAESRKVFGRFCLIQFGIPATLLFLQWLMLIITGRGLVPKIERLFSLLIAAGLLVAGLGLWWFFGAIMFRRLWQIFPIAGDERKFWVYAEGVFGLVGVGVSMPALLGFFHFLLFTDIVAGSILGGVSLALAFYETGRFGVRVGDAATLADGAKKRMASQEGEE